MTLSYVVLLIMTGQQHGITWLVGGVIKTGIMVPSNENVWTFSYFNCGDCLPLLLIILATFRKETPFGSLTSVNIEKKQILAVSPECVARVPVSLGGVGVELCSPHHAFVAATARNRPQPFATVRNRSQPFA